MGIPKFFRWISERYPMCLQPISDKLIPEFDNLYMDVNGLIHTCLRSNDNSSHLCITDRQMCLGIFNYLDHVFSKIKPTKLLFLAIDGVAPRAKMNDQRLRRFRNARDAEKKRQIALSKGEDIPEEDIIISNSIKPGTKIMEKLSAELRYFINKKVSEDAEWRDVEVVLSGPEVPGEGEHKIMEFIRLQKAQPNYDPNTRHCVYGLDADLIVLGLLSHEPHFALLREEVIFDKNKKTNKTPLDKQNLYLLHLSLMREYLNIEFRSLKGTLKFDYDFERILDDFILLVLFVGNDFLPNLPSLSISEGGLDLMFKTYKKILPECEGYIQDSGHINLSRLQKLLDALSSTVERKSFAAENTDMLSLPSKSEDEEPEVPILLQIEQKKNTNDMDKIIQYIQQQSFQLVKRYLENTFKVRTVYFDHVFKTIERECINNPNTNFKIALHVVHNPDDRSANVLSKKEDDDDNNILTRNHISKKYKTTEPILTKLTEQDVQHEKEKKLDNQFRRWKADYYMEKMHIDINNKNQMDNIIGQYIIGIQWILKYYYEGVASWSWFYPYHYCPIFSDLVNSERFQDYTFEFGQPFTPYEQLMAVLPRASKHLLPRAYQTLLTEPTSPIIDFYPTVFDLDTNGMKHEWEAVLKIPFIDEKRLLNAMKTREDQLTEEERSMPRIGTIWRIFHDASIAQMDSGSIPSYKSPSPGIFPDIVHCLAREVLYHLPTLNNGIELRKGLLPGTKIGRDALPGFPSLDTIPYFDRVRFHQINLFQQDSRNQSIVISIHNRYTKDNAKDLAIFFLDCHVYVHYPFLQEAIVIGVSTSEKKYYSKLHNGTKQIYQRCWDDMEVINWRTRMARTRNMNSKTFGLIVGKIEVGLHVCVLNGMHQTEEGALVKEFTNPIMEELIPVQLVVQEINNMDPRFFEQPPQSIAETFPLRSTVFLLHPSYLGKQATVIGYSEDQVNIEMQISTDESYQSEPTFGYIAVHEQEKEAPYIPLRDLAHGLDINPFTLSCLTSNYFVMNKDGKLTNMGLNIKPGPHDQKVPGYSRTNPVGYWEFSTKAVNLIKEFTTQFPDFVRFRDENISKKMSVYDFYWAKDQVKELERMKAWRAENKIEEMEKISFDINELDGKYVKMIEEAAAQYMIAYNKIPLKTVILDVSRKVLLKPEDAKIKLKYQKFRLGDRVVYATNTGTIPLGMRGTVVGVNTKFVDILFDSTFIGGSDLGGRCSPFHGLNIPFSSVINVSNTSHEVTIFK